MSAFKPGDKVRRINSNWGWVKVGAEYEVREVFSEHSLKLVGVPGMFNPEHFELVQAAVVVLPLVTQSTTTSFRKEMKEVTEMREVSVPVVENNYTLNLNEEDALLVRMGMWLLTNAITEDRKREDSEPMDAEGANRIHAALRDAGVGSTNSMKQVIKLGDRMYGNALSRGVQVMKPMTAQQAMQSLIGVGMVVGVKVPRPAVTKPSGWIVQFHDQHCGDPKWVFLDSGAAENYPGSRAYTSRNEAYRMMRERVRRTGIAASYYRVVPAGTPDGPELDRGYYKLQVWDSHYGWENSALNCAQVAFSTAEQAESETAKSRAVTGLTYRIKWFPNK